MEELVPGVGFAFEDGQASPVCIAKASSSASTEFMYINTYA